MELEPIDIDLVEDAKFNTRPLKVLGGVAAAGAVVYGGFVAVNKIGDFVEDRQGPIAAAMLAAGGGIGYAGLNAKKGTRDIVIMTGVTLAIGGCALIKDELPNFSEIGEPSATDAWTVETTTTEPQNPIQNNEVVNFDAATGSAVVTIPFVEGLGCTGVDPIAVSPEPGFRTAGEIIGRVEGYDQEEMTLLYSDDQGWAVTLLSLPENASQVKTVDINCPG